jgi:penicillin-binding protein 1A
MMVRITGRLARNFGIAALFLAAALAGTAGGVLFAFTDDLPQISALDDYSPGLITRVVGRDGATVGEFATERRQVVSFDDIPVVLRQAIMSAEDSEFMSHSGVRVDLMLYAAVQDVLTTGRTPGRSTITQQLARQLFPESVGFERAWARKIREALVALQIEKRYTKEEILTMYCNKVAWGNRAFGVEAASQLYFGKPAVQLTLDEAATIAGILPAPQRLNPYANMAAAVRRRNYTLDRMAEEGYITAEAAEAAKGRPIVTHGQPTVPSSAAPYFLEAIRTELEARYGASALYEDGLVIRTGLDVDLQRAAARALDNGVRRLDKLRGYRRPTRTVEAAGRTIDTYRHPRWARDPVVGDVVPAVVTALTAADVNIRIGRFTGVISRTGYAWTGRRPADLARPGDIIDVRVSAIDDRAATLDGALEQVPAIQGAVLAVENRTGQILAMVGGENFERSQFNRSTQALRQVGSLFKPFVYAAAIDRGYTTASLVDDSPASFVAGPGQPPYEPGNYDRAFRGIITLRDALEDSRNVPAVRLMAALGPREVVGYARRLGITAPLPEYLSVAIGSAEATLLEMVSAYAAFANQGVRMTPLPFLEVADRDGNILEQHRAEPHEAIRADTAYITTSMLQGVIERGTAASVRSLNWPLAGKTGTTDDYSDAWFIGFDPDITVGVWVGYDQKRPIGAGQSGSVAALPIWRDIMASWIERQRKLQREPPTFERPGNIVTATTSRGPDVFIAGTEPQ